MTYDFAWPAGPGRSIRPRQKRLSSYVSCAAPRLPGWAPQAYAATPLTSSPSAWAKVVSLPVSVPRTGKISRGDVLDIGERVRKGTSPATELLVTSFVWGWGTTGFGPSRLRGILDAAGESWSLRSSVRWRRPSKRLTRLIPSPGMPTLYGGYMTNESDTRAAPGTQEWARLWGYGPAFFTKLLYFAVPEALILDNRLANAVHDLSGLPSLVTQPAVPGRGHPTGMPSTCTGCARPRLPWASSRTCWRS